MKDREREWCADLADESSGTHRETNMLLATLTLELERIAKALESLAAEHGA